MEHRRFASNYSDSSQERHLDKVVVGMRQPGDLAYRLQVGNLSLLWHFESRVQGDPDWVCGTGRRDC
jgi:hypothetical protein